MTPVLRRTNRKTTGEVEIQNGPAAAKRFRTFSRDHLVAEDVAVQTLSSHEVELRILAAFKSSYYREHKRCLQFSLEASQALRMTDSEKRQFFRDYDQILENHPNDRAAQSEAYARLVLKYEICESTATYILRNINVQAGPAAREPLSKEEKNSFIQAHIALLDIPIYKDREAQMVHIRESYGLNKDAASHLLRGLRKSGWTLNGYKRATSSEAGVRPQQQLAPAKSTNRGTLQRPELTPITEAVYSAAFTVDHVSACQPSPRFGVENSGGVKRSASEMLSSAPYYSTTVKTECEDLTPAALCAYYVKSSFL